MSTIQPFKQRTGECLIAAACVVIQEDYHKVRRRKAWKAWAAATDDEEWAEILIQLLQPLGFDTDNWHHEVSNGYPYASRSLRIQTLTGAGILLTKFVSGAHAVAYVDGVIYDSSENTFIYTEMAAFKRSWEDSITGWSKIPYIGPTP